MVRFHTPPPLNLIKRTVMNRFDEHGQPVTNNEPSKARMIIVTTLVCLFVILPFVWAFS
jgi:hypothetical protein